MARYDVIPLLGRTALVIWNEFKHYFELAALEHPESVDMEDVRARVADGRMMSIGIFDGVSMIAGAAVELYDARDGKTLHVRYLAGEHMEMWLEELQARLFEIAAAYGCRWLSLTGRQGWRKRLSNMGWNPVAIQMRCEVPGHGKCE